MGNGPGEATLAGSRWGRGTELVERRETRGYSLAMRAAQAAEQAVASRASGASSNSPPSFSDTEEQKPMARSLALQEFLQGILSSQEVVDILWNRSRTNPRVVLPPCMAVGIVGEIE